MQPVVIYCYDAYCGWCYGFSPVIKKIAEEYKDRFDIEVLSGGMILPEKPKHINITAGYIQKAYKTVEELTGIKFGQDYLWHINNPAESDWYPNSEKPAIALCVFKEYYPDLQVAFASDLQYSLHYEGRDLCDDEAYLHLLQQYEIPVDEFYEIALCKQLQVTGFPTLLLQVSESKFYLLARGFTKYENLKPTIDGVLDELARN